MKVHTDLKELLEDYTKKYFDKYFNGFPRVQSKFIDAYVSSNNLALGKPEPLAKNKQTENDFSFKRFKEASEYEDEISKCTWCQAFQEKFM